MKPALLRFSLGLLPLWLLALAVMAQTATPAPKTYTYLIYHKLAPGMTIQDALPVEREWRVLNQAAVDEGNLLGWHMLVKQFTSNPNPSEYDYVTCIVSAEMAIKGASPAARSRIYGDSVQFKMADLQRRDRLTAPVVKMEIWENSEALLGAGFDPAKTPMLVVNFIKPRDPVADPTAVLTLLKRQGAERIQAGQLAEWGFSTLKVPNGSEKGYQYAQTQCAASMAALVDNGPLSPEAVKVRTQQLKAFDVVRQDVFRIQEFTVHPKNRVQATR